MIAMIVVTLTPLFCSTITLDYYKKDLTYTINAYKQNITIPNKISLTSFISLLLLMNYVNGLKIGPGNTEEDYLILADERDGLFKNKQGI